RVFFFSSRRRHTSWPRDWSSDVCSSDLPLLAANSLLLLHDDVGYDTYFEVLTGEKRASKGLIKEQLDTLKDKKKMAELGFEQGIGFIPFAGIGYEVFKTVTKDDS